MLVDGLFVAPCSSNARMVMVYLPARRFVVSHPYEPLTLTVSLCCHVHGLSALSVLFTKSRTVFRYLSEALNLTITVPKKYAPATGSVIVDFWG